MRDAAKSLIPVIMERPAPVRMRRAKATDLLVGILADAVLNDLLRELEEKPSCGEPDSDTRVMRKQPLETEAANPGSLIGSS